MSDVFVVQRQPHNPGVQASGVVLVHVDGNIHFGSAHIVIGLQINALVFDAEPHTLDEYIVLPDTTPVLRKQTVMRMNNLGELGSSELAALIGIDDLWRTVAGKDLFDNLFGMVCFRRLATSTTAAR